MGRIDIFGVGIDAMPRDVALDAVCVAAAGERTQGLGKAFFVNADCLNRAWTDFDYKLTLADASMVFADGSGVRMAARKLGFGAIDNVNGTDMFPQLCARSAAPGGPSLFLLGGKPGVADRCAEAMRAACPGVKIVGVRDGYIRTPEENDAALAQIADCKPDILLVGMGAPRQEMWIDENASRIAAKVAMGVGGLFDYYSGDIPRAPDWMRLRGVEWIWRLWQEPRRLARRYLIGNPLFLFRLRRYAREVGQAEGNPGKWFAREIASRRQDARKEHLRLSDVWTRSESAKRMLDVAASGSALIALSPLFLLVIAAIKLESKGPAFFWQTRVGRRGVTFSMVKFRSMRSDAEAVFDRLKAKNEMAGGVIFKMKHDPRVTMVGRFLRRTSIDELPQLWNILIGDMTLVGPRPPLPREVALYSASDRRRLNVRPGLTGPWQVSGRSNIAFAQQVEMDVDYAARRGFWTDVKLILKTIPAVLAAKGAY